MIDLVEEFVFRHVDRYAHAVVKFSGKGKIAHTVVRQRALWRRVLLKPGQGTRRFACDVTELGRIMEAEDDIVRGIGKERKAVGRGPDGRDVPGDVLHAPVHSGQPQKDAVRAVHARAYRAHERVGARGVHIGAAPDRLTAYPGSVGRQRLDGVAVPALTGIVVVLTGKAGINNGESVFPVRVKADEFAFPVRQIGGVPDAAAHSGPVDLEIAPNHPRPQAVQPVGTALQKQLSHEGQFPHIDLEPLDRIGHPGGFFHHQGAALGNLQGFVPGIQALACQEQCQTEQCRESQYDAEHLESDGGGRHGREGEDSLFFHGEEGGEPRHLQNVPYAGLDMEQQKPPARRRHAFVQKQQEAQSRAGHIVKGRHVQSAGCAVCQRLLKSLAYPRRRDRIQTALKADHKGLAVLACADVYHHAYPLVINCDCPG